MKWTSVGIAWVLALTVGTAEAQDEDPCLEACAIEGRCTEQEGECIIASADDCEQSMDCELMGWCGFRDGECVPSEEGCRGSQGCFSEGSCSLSPEGDGCVTASDADCLDSMGCQYGGYCAFADGQCVISEEGCRTSENCAESGECTLKDGVCRATSDADCAKSDACFQGGRCGHLKGECEAISEEDCAKSAFCESTGRCGLVDGECVAQSEAHCEASTGCAQSGRCGLLKDRCGVRNVEDCTSSKDCKDQSKKACFYFEAQGGYCGLEDGSQLGISSLLGSMEPLGTSQVWGTFEGGDFDTAMAGEGEAIGGFGLGTAGMGGGGGGGGVSGGTINPEVPEGTPAPTQVIDLEAHACTAPLEARVERTADGAERRWCEDEAGRKQGILVARHVDGLLSSVAYVNGDMHGPFLLVRGDRLVMRGEHVNGVREGIWEQWHDDGTPAAVGVFTGDVSVGLWRLYDRKGEERLCNALSEDCRP